MGLLRVLITVCIGLLGILNIDSIPFPSCYLKEIQGAKRLKDTKETEIYLPFS